MQLVVVMAVKNAVRAATITFTTISITLFDFISDFISFIPFISFHFFHFYALGFRFLLRLLIPAAVGQFEADIL